MAEGCAAGPRAGLQPQLGATAFHVAGQKYVDAVRLAGALPLSCRRPRRTRSTRCSIWPTACSSPARRRTCIRATSARTCSTRVAAARPARDAWTLPLIPQVLERGIPLFAICRGFQEANVALGGTLHQAVHELPRATPTTATATTRRSRCSTAPAHERRRRARRRARARSLGGAPHRRQLAARPGREPAGAAACASRRARPTGWSRLLGRPTRPASTWRCSGIPNGTRRDNPVSMRCSRRSAPPAAPTATGTRCCRAARCQRAPIRRRRRQQQVTYGAARELHLHRSRALARRAPRHRDRMPGARPHRRGARQDPAARATSPKTAACACPKAVVAMSVTGEVRRRKGPYYDVIRATDRDMHLRPDPTTVRIVPWAADPTAQVIHDCYDRDGRLVPFAPRSVLRRVCELYDDAGLGAGRRARAGVLPGRAQHRSRHAAASRRSAAAAAPRPRARRTRSTR